MRLPGVGRCARGPAPGIPPKPNRAEPSPTARFPRPFWPENGRLRGDLPIQGSYQPGTRIFPPLSRGIRLEFLSSWTFYPPGIPVPCSYLFELPCHGAIGSELPPLVRALLSVASERVHGYGGTPICQR